MSLLNDTQTHNDKPFFFAFPLNCSGPPKLAGKSAERLWYDAPPIPLRQVNILLNYLRPVKWDFFSFSVEFRRSPYPRRLAGRRPSDSLGKQIMKWLFSLKRFP